MTINNDENNFIIKALDQINHKLDRHDDKLETMEVSLRHLVKLDTQNNQNIEAIKKIFNRLETLEESIKKSLIESEQFKNSFNILIKDLNDNKDKVKNIEDRVKSIEDKPLKLIDKFTLTIVGALGTAIVAFLITKLGA